MLEGFNCTVFAYGQTGTGKTHTMQGDCSCSGGVVSDAGGVVPRALFHAFTSLEAAKAEYSVKCTFLELYNEEITDLLSADDEVDPRRAAAAAAVNKLQLMEDGKGGVLVRGLEEVIVMNAAEVFPLLERGTAKRRTAETLLNKQSSRSHCVFSVTIHIKEMTGDGEELIKIGKLNLVDLAGSENIGRSGATDKRAREAGEINKSLLTLGRVITSLVEHQGHVPYRDSKLTRLLRDALGGRSKTCIIATVAPGVHCLDETLSTLDYAHRAKNIRNKPEVNARTTKTALIKDMVHEIERLKADLVATREKNGIYMAPDRWAEFEAERVSSREKMDALVAEIALREAELADVRTLCDRTASDMAALSERHEAVVANLGATQEALDTSRTRLAETAQEAADNAALYAASTAAEAGLARLSVSLASTLRGSVAEVNALFDKVDRTSATEAANASALVQLRQDVASRLDALHCACEAHAQQQSATAASAADALAALARVQQAEAEAMAAQAVAMQEAAQRAVVSARAAADVVAALCAAETRIRAVSAASEAWVATDLPAAMDSARGAVVESAARFVRDLPTGQTPLKTTSVALSAAVPSSPVIASMRAPERDVLLAQLRAPTAAVASEDTDEAVGAVQQEAPMPPPREQVEHSAPAAAAVEKALAKGVTTARGSSNIPRGGLGRSRSANKAEVEEAARSVLSEVSNL